MTKKDKKAFSILEVLVWIFIFSMWIISVYSIIITTLNLNDYNKNYIIASSLAREQLELVRNIRDSNYKKIQIYNQINPNSNDHTRVFEFDKYYKVENDLASTATFPVSVSEITDFWEWEINLNTKMQDYKLCIDPRNFYTYSCAVWNKQTHFYKYIKIEKVKYNDWSDITITSAFKVTSKVIWYMKWYHEFEIDTIFTDFKRL